MTLLVEVLSGPSDGDWWTIDEKDLDLHADITPLGYPGNNMPVYRLTLHERLKRLVFLFHHYEANPDK